MDQNLQGRPVSCSAVHEQLAVVFPDDLNTNGTLFGGRVLEMADRLCAIVAKRHTGRACVTLGIDSVRFLAPAHHGDILIFQASINRVWRSSMEVGIRVTAENYVDRKAIRIFSAYFTFVAVDEFLKPVSIAPAIPETEEEKRRYIQAEERRRHRMSMGQKSKGTTD
ncbi:MAG: acyl-CoA thioesterase [Simkania sp.]|nr:acyl-CoA thioesterase [Simkania sp.]